MTREVGRKFLRNVSLFLLLTASLSVLSACGNTQPTNFYLLGPLQSPEPLIASTVEGPTIGIGPVDLAPYLDRPQIVKRQTLHELDLAEFHKWGEPLKDNVARILEENLSHLLSTDRVVIFPWSGSVDPEYQVPVSLRRFDSTAEGETVLEAHWEIRTLKGTGNPVIQRSRFRVPTTGTGYPETVAGMSQTLGDLSRTIAEAIVSLDKSGRRP